MLYRNLVSKPTRIRNRPRFPRSQSLFWSQWRSQIIQELRCRGGARHEQMVAGTGAGDVKQMTFGVVNVLKVGLVGDGLNPFLKWNHVIVTSHHCDCPELQAFGKMHGTDGQPSNRRRDVFVENIKTESGGVCRGFGPV